MGSSDYFKPPATKGHTSVVRIADDWYILCRSESLKTRPLAVTLLGTPLVLFRDESGHAAALLDRCAHRNTPLSLGEVKGHALQCSYHGWQFDAHGECCAVPGLHGEPRSAGRHVPAYAVREQQGFVWVYATPDVEPARALFQFPLLKEKGYTAVVQEMMVEASVHAAAENALDVPHTVYLHGGLFRSTSGQRREIEVKVRRSFDRVEAEYIGERRPSGLVGRILAPGGGEVTHVDRFILPSIAQVEYKLGQSTHICVTTALTPVHDYHTRLFSVVSLRLPVPGWLIAPVLRPIGLRIFQQDADILKRQTETIKQFGGEQFSSTEIDVLGGHIYRLLRQAERGERNSNEEPVSTTLRMIV